TDDAAGSRGTVHTGGRGRDSRLTPSRTARRWYLPPAGYHRRPLAGRRPRPQWTAAYLCGMRIPQRYAAGTALGLPRREANFARAVLSRGGAGAGVARWPSPPRPAPRRGVQARSGTGRWARA